MNSSSSVSQWIRQNGVAGWAGRCAILSRWANRASSPQTPHLRTNTPSREAHRARHAIHGNVQSVGTGAFFHVDGRARKADVEATLLRRMRGSMRAVLGAAAEHGAKRGAE